MQQRCTAKCGEARRAMTVYGDVGSYSNRSHGARTIGAVTPELARCNTSPNMYRAFWWLLASSRVRPEQLHAISMDVHLSSLESEGDKDIGTHLRTP